MHLTREFLRRGVAVGIVLGASSIVWGPSATASRVLSSSGSAALQGGCGYTYTYAIRSQDTLCCPPTEDGEQTCVEVRCTNYFCEVILPFGNRQCWQNLYLCASLFCAESNIVRELWAEDDRDIACPPGPILTGGRSSVGDMVGGDYVGQKRSEACAGDPRDVRGSGVAARFSSGAGGH